MNFNRVSAVKVLKSEIVNESKVFKFEEHKLQTMCSSVLVNHNHSLSVAAAKYTIIRVARTCCSWVLHLNFEDVESLRIDLRYLNPV